MGSSSAAVKAHQTRQLFTAENERRKRAGLPPLSDAEKDYYKRHRRFARQPSNYAAPTSIHGSSQPNGGIGGAAQASSIRNRVEQVATKPSQDDELTRRLRSSVQLVEPTWQLKGDLLRITSPTAKKPVELKRAKRPGPYTPAEEVPPILGQPQLLHTIAVAFATGEHSLVVGKTGTGKTTVYRWLAKTLNWNLVMCPMHPDVESEDLVGEYKPTGSDGKQSGVPFDWTWMPVSEAVRASGEHPTILVFDELNRGRVQALTRIYSLLDDSRELKINEKRSTDGVAETLRPGELHIGATMNPEDDERSNHIGTQPLDDALKRRFPKQIVLGYPPEEIEAAALKQRVPTLDEQTALRIDKDATAIRNAPTVVFPVSFPDLVSWANGLEYWQWEEAAEYALVAKTSEQYRASVRDAVQLKPIGGV